jgi:glycosyltransferase involved in cell wall biosynthesis
MLTRRTTATEVYHGLREAPDTAEITNAAREAFARSNPDVKLQRLVIVIAAYNEAANIGAVLDEIPDQIADVAVSRLVIDDGSSDGTSSAAQRHGALVCTLSANRGHGVALRLGYRIAREAGAEYIGTLDGDGQWDPADLPAMVRLLEEGRADFVVGSRQLGRTENTDSFRNLGVRFFARLISVLTHTHLTDTSSGLRAMRADLTAVVRQTQPQYQTSELLIGALFQGFRVAEVPTTMRQRLSGVTKKGDNLFYGLRYARVIGRTWWRERKLAAHGTRRRPLAQAAGEPVSTSPIPTTPISASPISSSKVSTSTVSTSQRPQRPGS